MSLGAEEIETHDGSQSRGRNASPMQRRPSARSRWSFWSPPDRRHSLEQNSSRIVAG
jgi:hypothetical protein